MDNGIIFNLFLGMYSFPKGRGSENANAVGVEVRAVIQQTDRAVHALADHVPGAPTRIPLRLGQGGR